MKIIFILLHMFTFAVQIDHISFNHSNEPTTIPNTPIQVTNNTPIAYERQSFLCFLCEFYTKLAFGSLLLLLLITIIVLLIEFNKKNSS